MPPMSGEPPWCKPAWEAEAPLPVCPLGKLEKQDSLSPAPGGSHSFPELSLEHEALKHVFMAPSRGGPKHPVVTSVLQCQGGNSVLARSQAFGFTWFLPPFPSLILQSSHRFWEPLNQQSSADPQRAECGHSTLTRISNACLTSAP